MTNGNRGWSAPTLCKGGTYLGCCLWHRGPEGPGLLNFEDKEVSEEFHEDRVGILNNMHTKAKAGLGRSSLQAA